MDFDVWLKHVSLTTQLLDNSLKSSEQQAVLQCFQNGLLFVDSPKHCSERGGLGSGVIGSRKFYCAVASD